MPKTPPLNSGSRWLAQLIAVWLGHPIEQQQATRTRINIYAGTLHGGLGTDPIGEIAADIIDGEHAIVVSMPEHAVDGLIIYPRQALIDATACTSWRLSDQRRFMRDLGLKKT